MNWLIDLTSQADYIHKSMLIRSLVKSQMLFMYPPKDEDIHKLDKLIKDTLRSKKHAGTLYGRVKIAAHPPVSPQMLIQLGIQGRFLLISYSSTMAYYIHQAGFGIGP